MMNVIEAAVLPLKAEAVARAEKMATDIVANIMAKLEAVGWDQNLYAPCPRSFGMSREEYQQKQALYSLVCTLTKWQPGNAGRFGSPTFVEPDPKGIEKFVENSKEDAAFAYDKFVAKLVAKIGACDTATLAGNHVWDFSVLTVTKGATTEYWKTQSIWNRSKYGRPFAQWPTRKVKGPTA